MNIDELMRNATIIPGPSNQPSEMDNTIVDPNLKRAYGQPRPRKNHSYEQVEVTPEQMGFKPKPVEKGEDDEDKVLNMLDNVIIPKKVKEVIDFNESIEAGGGQLSEEEWRREQGMDHINEMVGTKLKDANKVESNERINPLDDFNSHLDEIEQLEKDFYDEEEEDMVDEDDGDILNSTPTTQKPTLIVNPIENKETTVHDNVIKKATTVEDKDIEKIIKIPEADKVEFPSMSTFVFPDDEKEEDDDVIADSPAESQDKQVEMLKSAIKEKIKPITNTFDISTFSISTKPVTISNTLANNNAPKVHVVDWALYSSEKPITMKGFTGTEIDKISNVDDSRNRYNALREQWGTIYEHIIDPNKPETFEQWLKVTSYLDIDDIWMAIYKACFEGANYLPYNCTNRDCNHVWLTDDMDIMEMVKFKDDKAKNKFNEILNKESDPSHQLMHTEIVPISNTYAMAFREPSIYNMLFEISLLDPNFTKKYQDLIAIIVYIDNIYYIDMEAKQLRPITVKEFPNNAAKAIRARIIQYSKVIRTLTSDQYNILLGYMQEINKIGDDIQYILPEATCPKCGAKITEQVHRGNDLVFTRHQLASIAAL